MGGSQQIETQVVDENWNERTETGATQSDHERLKRWRSVLDGRFAFLEQRSSTRASWVYRGTDVRSGQAVAIKLLKDPGRASRNAFVAEAMLLSELEHPGIVRYIAHGEFTDGGAYLVTEWLRGEDLSGFLRTGALSTTNTLTLLVRSANVLAAAHARGIVHLDLKPSNLFLVDGNLTDIRLLDFGIARLMRSSSSDPEEGTIAGTPGYMAPEQVLGDPVSPATDVFALGCLVFRCLTGEPIFQGDGFEVMTRTVSEPASRLSALAQGVHPALDDLCASMLELDPAERPADAATLLAAIAALPAEVLDGVAASARALLTPSGLTGAERVPITVVLVRPPAGEGGADAAHAWAMDRSGSFEALSDGTWIALPRGNATALDQALHAARLTLDVRAHSPDAAIAVSAGRTVDRSRTPQLHELLAEAEALLGKARAGEILLDETCAALVGDRFALGRGEAAATQLLGDGAPDRSGAGAAGGAAVCLGRDDELQRMEEVSDDAFQAPKGRVLLVTGPAGIGKSHVTREFLDRVARRHKGVRVWSAYGDSMSASSTLRLVTALMHSAARRAAMTGRPAAAAVADVVESTMPPESSRTAVTESTLVRLLSTDGARSAQAGEGGVEEVYRAFSESVRAELAHGPLILQLEDIHWADLGSLRAIDYALSVLEGVPLLVVATARPDVRDLYPDLWIKRPLVEIRLRELADRDADRLVSVRLGADLAAAARTRIVARARGNAFLLQELIRAEAEGRGEETPETALGVVQSRLRAFDPDARRVLRAASVFGEAFTFAGLACLLGEESSKSDIEGWLELLTAREVIRRREEGPDGKGFAFAHALVRDAAYDLLTDGDRRLGHKLAAEWLDGAGHGHPLVTAQHYERAGDDAAAGRCYLRATVEAFELGDYGATLRAAERALALDLSQNDRGHMQAVAAHAYRLVGDLEASRRLSAEALRSLPPNSPLWRQAARTAMMAGASTARHRES